MPNGDTRDLSSWLAGGNGNRYRLVVVIVACGLGILGVVLYIFESRHLWVQLWVPSIAGALLVGALTVLALDVLVNTALEKSQERRLEPLRVGYGRELPDLRKKVDLFLVNWQFVIGDLRNDYLEVLNHEGWDDGTDGKEPHGDNDTDLFPQQLLSQLPVDTFDLLMAGWGQPNHESVLAHHTWSETVEFANQVKRQSDRIVQWYSRVLDPSIPTALAQIQEYLLGVVENMPKEALWFDKPKPHQDFLDAYRTIWPRRDSEVEAERLQDQGLWRRILQVMRKGLSERYAQEQDRSYEHPALVDLYDAVNPWGQREDFYLELIESARAVLDLGCGTGRLLKRAANASTKASWPGSDLPVFFGVDRSSSMLAEANPRNTTRIVDSTHESPTRQESRINWQLGDVRMVDLGRRFDLITITGRTVNELLTDDDLRMMLSNVLRHLDPAGRLAFDVACRGGPGTYPSPAAIRVATSSGENVDVVRATERSTHSDLTEFTTTYAFAGSANPFVSRSVLRVIDRDHLRALLEDVGLRIDRWFGDWDRIIPSTPSDVVDVVVATRRCDSRSTFLADDVEPVAPPGAVGDEPKRPATHSESRSNTEAPSGQADNVEPVPPSVDESRQVVARPENGLIVEAAGSALHHAPSVHPPRLRLKPEAPLSGYVDGAWWPRSDDLTTEVSGLLAVLSARLGQIGRMLYNLDEWVRAPRKLAAEGRTVRLDGYRRQPVNTVEVVGLDRNRIVLLVVPPHTRPDQAHATMMAAATPNNACTVDNLLAVSV
jgi:SAM-dependent methyltransferase